MAVPFQLVMRERDLTRLQAEADQAAEQQRVSSLSRRQWLHKPARLVEALNAHTLFSVFLSPSPCECLTASVEARSEALQCELDRCRDHTQSLQAGDFQTVAEHIVRALRNSAAGCKGEEEWGWCGFIWSSIRSYPDQ